MVTAADGKRQAKDRGLLERDRARFLRVLEPKFRTFKAEPFTVAELRAKLTDKQRAVQRAAHSDRSLHEFVFDWYCEREPSIIERVPEGIDGELRMKPGTPSHYRPCTAPCAMPVLVCRGRPLIMVGLLLSERNCLCADDRRLIF